MKPVVNRTTRNDNNKNKITNINYDQNSDKPRQNKLTYLFLEKI